jgi:hypothetical protein
LKEIDMNNSALLGKLPYERLHLKRVRAGEYETKTRYITAENGLYESHRILSDGNG